MSKEQFYYSKGFINFNNRICLFAASLQLEEENKQHALIGIYNSDKKKWQIWDEGFTIVSAAAGSGSCTRGAVLVGRRGKVLSISCDGSISYDQIKGEGRVPNQYSGLSEVKRINQAYFAVGMRRQVYFRDEKKGEWKRIDNGAFVKRAGEEIAGFLSVDGFTMEEVYCVGYRGEIWWFNGAAWTRVESPTNAILGSITCASDGLAYVGGDDGVLLVGRKEAWRDLAQDITDDHITSSVEHNKDIYFSTETGVIFKFNGDLFEEVTFPDSLQWNGTTGFLSSNGKKLLAIGKNDILMFDDKGWTRISDPKF